MVRSIAWFAALLLGAGLLAPGTLLAQSRVARTVQDDAGLFSKAAIAKANSDIALIKSKHGKDFFVETLKEGPAKDQAAWARNRAKNANINGVYLVFTAEPKHFEVVVGNKTKEKLFRQSDSDHLVKILRENMKSDRDAALQKSADYVLEAMNTNAKAGAGQKAAAADIDEDGFFHDAPAQPAAQRSTMSPWVGYALIIGGVLIVGWLIMAVLRGLGSMAGGGGGGGFMTGMLGGLFGAMAGMWIYNSFFGGSHAYGADPGAGVNGADTDYGSTGGDDFGGKGDDAGGGDWGDAGDKGGDAGGGGDWGGGGGDWGGGGGGDW
jgi:hypothetical protein